MTDRAEDGWSARGVIRAFLYQSYRFEGGCPASGACTLMASVGKKTRCAAANLCPRFVTPEEVPPPPEFFGWLRRLFRLEGLREAGCRFAVNDLSPQDWTALITIGQERGRMDRLVSEARGRVAKAGRPAGTVDDPAAAAALQEARKVSGAPPPGGSLFGATGKFRRPVA